MTIPALATQPSITFTVVENGVYNLPFDVFDDSNNLQAWYRDSADSPQDLKFGTDLVINFDSGFGTIFLVKDLAVGSKFTVVRTIQNDQTKTFKSTQLFSTQIENALDKLTTIAQDNDFEKTCIRTASDEDAKLELPINQNRVFTALTINEEGDVETKPLRNIGVKAPATRSDLGFVKIGDKLSIEDTGLVNIPSADNSTFGVVKVGEGINLNDGAISVDLPGIATESKVGLVKVGNKLTIAPDGTLNVPKTDNSTLGVAKISGDFALNDGVISVDTSGIEQNITTAEGNSTTANTLSATVPPKVSVVESVASTAKTKVNEQVVCALLAPAGVTWTAATTPPSGYYNALAVENGRWVAVGQSSVAAYSTDGGVTWTAATTPPSGNYYSVAVENGSWVAVGVSSKAAYSTDGGVTWTSATTPPPSGNYYSVAVENGRWVAVGQSSKAAYSTDGGATWTSARTPPSGDYLALAAENGRLVAVGVSSKAAYSTDGGVTWTAATTPPSGNYYGLAVENGRWVAVGESKAAYSTDGGVTWTSVTTPPSGHYRALAAENGRLVAVGVYSKAAYSTDGGVTWTSATTPPSGDYYSVAVENGSWVAVGLSSKAAYSTVQYEYLTVPDAVNRVLEQKGV